MSTLYHTSYSSLVLNAPAGPEKTLSVLVLFLCFLKVWDPLNSFTQMSHVYLMPSCALFIWAIMLDLLIKCFSHFKHRYFFPSWMLSTWSCRAGFELNCLSHSTHLYFVKIDNFKRSQHAGAYSFGFLPSSLWALFLRFLIWCICEWIFVTSVTKVTSVIKVTSMLLPLISQCTSFNSKYHNFHSERFSAEVFSIFSKHLHM